MTSLPSAPFPRFPGESDGFAPHAPAPFRLPFFGGIVSAGLLLLAFDGDERRLLAWFALVPFFHSLLGHCRSARMRVLDGLGFGSLLGAVGGFWLFGWFPGTASAPSPRQGPDWIACALFWGSQAAYPGIFALAAGPILRSRRTAVPLVGLPVLWTGIEVLRGPFSLFSSLHLTNWLSLGYALGAGTPESQPASLFGVYGLSFAACLSATAFSLVLREASFVRQGLLALLACTVPLACRSYGAFRTTEGGEKGSATVAVVAQCNPDLETLVHLTRQVGPESPELVVWPSSPVAQASSRNPDATLSPISLGSFAREMGGTIVTGAGAPGPDDPPLEALVLDRQGLVTAVYPPGPAVTQNLGGSTRLPCLFSGPRGKAGLGIDSDLDSPWLARQMAAQDAGILISATRDAGSRGWKGVVLHAEMQRFRALENRRWLVMSGANAAFIADPFGRRTFHIEGVEAVGTGEVEWLSAQSFYTRAGWWLEPACIAGAGWIFVWGIIVRLVTRRTWRKLPPRDYRQ